MPREPQYYVVLDANILVADFWMNGTAFSYLLTHQFLQHRPVIPEVAYLEARNHLKRRAEELLALRSSARDSNGDSMRLLRLFNYKRAPHRGEWNVEKLLVRWERHVAAVLRRSNGSIIPNPEVDIDEITRRSIDRRKPFTKGDKGFRDTLIWLSTLELVKPGSRVSFVTRNTQDFFLEKSSEPHPDIIAEAKARIGDEWTMLFHRSLDEFITRFDSNRAASAEALQRSLISNTVSGFDLWVWLETNLAHVLGDDDFDEVPWAGVPYNAEAPVLKEVEQVVALDIPQVAHVEDDTYRLYCDVAFVGLFACAVPYVEAGAVVHPNQIVWKSQDGFWTDIGMRVVATVLFAIDFDVRSKTMVRHFWIPLPHWSTYHSAIDELERVRKEVEALSHNRGA